MLLRYIPAALFMIVTLVFYTYGGSYLLFNNMHPPLFCKGGRGD